MNIAHPGFSALLLLSFTACSGARPVQTEVMLEHQSCQTLEAGITPVTLDRVARIRGSRLITLNPNSTTPASSEAATTQPAGVVMFAISKGPMPTPGYRLTLKATELLEQKLTVKVNWQTPATDAALAQVVTHPCLVIAVPVTEATELVVQEANAELARLAL